MGGEDSPLPLIHTQMKITKTYDWSRRDFSYDDKCEHCGYTSKNNSGYDDSNYYNNVMPQVKCKQCGESSLSKASDEPKTIVVPRYDSNIVM